MFSRSKRTVDGHYAPVPLPTMRSDNDRSQAIQLVHVGAIPLVLVSPEVPSDGRSENRRPVGQASDVNQGLEDVWRIYWKNIETFGIAPLELLDHTE